MRFWTGISGNVGRMERAHYFSSSIMLFPKWSFVKIKVPLLTLHTQRNKLQHLQALARVWIYLQERIHVLQRQIKVCNYRGLLHPAGHRTLVIEPPSYMCVRQKDDFVIESFSIEEMWRLYRTMAAANFSRDVLEMFYGPIPNEENQRLRAPIRPRRRFDFEIARNNFNQWLGVWKMIVPGGNRVLLKFFQKTKNRFIDVWENEVETFKSLKIQFGLLVRFSMNRDEEV